VAGFKSLTFLSADSLVHKLYQRRAQLLPEDIAESLVPLLHSPIYHGVFGLMYYQTHNVQRAVATYSPVWRFRELNQWRWMITEGFGSWCFFIASTISLNLSSVGFFGVTRFRISQ